MKLSELKKIVDQAYDMLGDLDVVYPEWRYPKLDGPDNLYSADYTPGDFRAQVRDGSGRLKDIAAGCDFKQGSRLVFVID